MKYSVRIMPEAYHELEASAVWWAKHRSSEEALRWYDGFVVKLESLQSMPESHSLARENPRVAFELRELHYGLGSGTTHRALFRIVGTTVEVLSVRHVAQADINPDDLG